MKLPPLTNYTDDLELAIEIAREAAAAIRQTTTTSPQIKGDGTPVTDADFASDRVIRQMLKERAPSDAVLTEESDDSASRLSATRCWIVDPLDGTKQFVAGTGDYDVLIALVIDGRPVVALSCHPPTGLFCWAASGGGAWSGVDGDWRPLAPPPYADTAHPAVVTSVWYGAPECVPLVTAALAGDGIAPPVTLETGFNPRYWTEPDRRLDAFIGWVPDGWMAGGEWDLVVTDLIVNEAGGVCTRLDGELHRYNKPDARNTGGILIARDADLHARLLRTLEPALTRALA